MQAKLETTKQSGQRINIKLQLAPIEKEIDARIRALSWHPLNDGSGLDDMSPNLSPESNSNRVREDIISGAMHSSFLEAMRQHRLRAADNPQFDPAVEADGVLSFSVNFESLPSISTDGYDDIQINRPIVEITATDIDTRLASFRKQYENSARQIDAALGEALKGKTLNATDNTDPALRAKVKLILENELTNAVSQTLKHQVIDALYDKYRFTPPEAMVQREFDSRMANNQQRTAENPSIPIPATEIVRRNSVRAVAMSLIFQEIIKAARIKKEDDRVRCQIEAIANGHENPAAVIEQYYASKTLLEQVENGTMIDMAIEWVLEKITITDVPASFSQLVQPSV